MKRIMCLVLASFILVECLYVTTSAQEKVLELGDYITLGKYNGEDIVWRYIADDENGKLMLSDEILCYKSFDSVGELDGIETKGSHALNGNRQIMWASWENGEIVNWQSGGSNYWGDSNIRSWLTSSEDEGEVKWLCNCPPRSEAERKEKGFLHSDNFSSSEKSLIKTVYLNNYLDRADKNSAIKGTEAGLKIDYKNRIAEVIPETMFLLDVDQIMAVKKNREFTSYLMLNDAWWTKTPYTGYILSAKCEYSSIYSLCVEKDSSEILFDEKWVDDIGYYRSDYSKGVRPAFYLNEENAEILSGGGTKEDPYVIDGKKEQNLKLGGYITLGKYNGEDIVWRYVADDENGILMFSDAVLCEKAFDEGSLDENRNFSERYGRWAGSSRWSKSSIRAWLNSEENENGFLNRNNFTSVEKNLMKTVSLNTGLDPQHYSIKNGGNDIERNELTIYYHDELNDENSDLYKKQSYETTKDRIFLIDITQLSKIADNADILFNSKDEIKNEFEITALRSAYGGFDYYDMGAQDSGYYIHTMYMMPNGSFYEESGDYSGSFKISYTPCFLQSKIRPAFYLNEENAEILSGGGTKEDPYVIDGKPVPERFEENYLYGYKDKEGNVIVPAKYLKAWEFSEGAALVVLPEDPYRLRYIDTTGNYLFDKAFYASNNFNNGYALVLTKDDPKYSYINKTGEFATELLFDDAEDFCGGYARVNMNGKWGVIDTNFNFKVPCEYDNKDEVLGAIK